MPKDIHPDLIHIINNHKQLFLTQLGKTKHVIDTGEVKFPTSYSISFHRKSTCSAARNGKLSNSPWCAPAVHKSWLAASPDGLVEDPSEPPDQQHGLLEIKCPYSARTHKPEAACTKLNRFLLQSCEWYTNTEKES